MRVIYLMLSEGVQSMPDGLIQFSLFCLSHGQTGRVHFQPFLFQSSGEEGLPLRGERQGLLRLRTLLIRWPCKRVWFRTGSLRLGV